MKVAYIITPYGSVEYLIRCLNSLYRQTNSDFDVILAENNFREYETEIRSYLDEHKDIRCISNKIDENVEKLREALVMLDEECEYVSLLKMDTVVTSMATELVIREALAAQIYVPTTIVKNRDKSENISISGSGWMDVKNFDLFGCYYNRCAISAFEPELVLDSDGFELYKFKQYLSGKIIGSQSICFYVEKKNEQEVGNTLFYHNEKVKELLIELQKSKNQELCINFLRFIFERYRQIFEVDEVDYEIKNTLYNQIKEIGLIIQTDVVSRKVYERYMGCSIENIQLLDFKTYYAFLDIINVASILKSHDFEIWYEEREISELNSIMAAQKKMQDDLGELKKNIHYLMKESSSKNVQNSINFVNSLEEIPQLFMQGKLGFRVIIQSFKGWINYKIRRK